ncbi:MAG: hypothetical protein JW900_08905 [Anaerolineae bacterium]|nr:hypothetical protein [Anaerolineae bacterium]
MLLLLLIALLALPLALVLRDLSQVILTELLRMIWVTRQQLDSLPQDTLWGLLLVAVLLVAVGSLFGQTRAHGAADGRPMLARGQVEELSRWIRRAAEGRYSRWTLNRYVSNLVWEVMAYRQHSTPQGLKRRFRAGEIQVPSLIAEYFESDSLLRPAESAGFWARLLRRSRAHAVPDRARPTLEDVVRFLEEQLEVEHDRGTG